MATIYIYDEIGDPFWGLVSAQGVAEQLDTFPEGEPLNVRINSPGGSVFEAVAIRQLFNEWQGEKTFYIDALAASAASFLPTPGANVKASASAFMMIHDPWTFGFGNAPEFRKKADLLDAIAGQIIDIYEARSNLGRDAITEMMADETWMTAAEAQEHGFVDEVASEESAVAACIRPDMFRNTPESLYGVMPKAEIRKEKAQETIRTGRPAAQVHEARMRLLKLRNNPPRKGVHHG